MFVIPQIFTRTGAVLVGKHCLQSISWTQRCNERLPDQKAVISRSAQFQEVVLRLEATLRNRYHVLWDLPNQSLARLYDHFQRS